jgi:hypothetical protein
MVGTELTKILAWFRIKYVPGCPCKDYAHLLNTKGVAWSQANAGTIVGWLRAEAARRKLPFCAVLGRLVVWLAIRNARKRLS